MTKVKTVTFKLAILQVLFLPIVGCTQAVSHPAKEATPQEIRLLQAPSTPDNLPVLENPEPNSSIPHNTESFTQGLLFHQGLLYEGTGHYGQSKLLTLDPKSGEVQNEVKLAEKYFGEGVAILDNKIYQLTWRAGVCLVYDTKLNAERELFYGTQGWGLTVDPKQKLLVLSDGTSQVRFLDPKTLITKRKITITDGLGRQVHNINELEWVRGEIWANVWTSAAICRINPESGQIKGWIHLNDLAHENQTNEADVLNGIAYDPESDTLWLTGKWWAKIYRFENVEKSFFGESQGKKG